MKEPSSKIKVGDVFQLTGGGCCTVVEYQSWDKVRIRHNDSYAHEALVQSSHLRRGSVKNPYWPTVYGVGFVGSGEHAASENKSPTREYTIWIGMIQRCYDEKTQSKYPTYIGVTVCNEWHNFQSFAAWLKAQRNWGREGFHIDKDLTVAGSKVYSPSTCALVPSPVNRSITACDSARGDFPVGVVFKKRDSRFYAQMNVDGVMRHIGSYASADEAFSAYKAKKKDSLRQLAEKYKKDISETIYKNLCSWEISPF